MEDESLDSSLSVCKKLAKTDQRINVYSKENEGVEKARLFGLKKCHGDYVTFVDSDDWLPRNAVKKLVNVLEKNDADVSFGTVTRVLDKWKLIKRKNVSEIYQNRVIEQEEFIQKHLSSLE